MNFENLRIDNLLNNLKNQPWTGQLQNTDLNLLFLLKAASLSVAGLGLFYLG